MTEERKVLDRLEELAKVEGERESTGRQKPAEMDKERELELRRMAEKIKEVYDDGGVPDAVKVVGYQVFVLMYDNYGGYTSIKLTEDQMFDLIQDARDRIRAVNNKLTSIIEDYNLVVGVRTDEVKR